MKIDLKNSKISFVVLLVSCALLLITSYTKYPKNPYLKRELRKYGSDGMSFGDYQVDILFISFSYSIVFIILTLLIATSIYFIIYKNDEEIKLLFFKIKGKTKYILGLINAKFFSFYKNSEPVEAKENNDPTKLVYSGFITRLIAFILDFLIFSFIVSFIWAIFYLPIPINSREFLSGEYLMIRHPLILVFQWIYYAFFESSALMASPGKRIMGVKVTNYKHERINFGRALVRNISKILSVVTIFFGFIMIMFTKKKQGLHDLISKAYVVEGVSDYKRGSLVTWGITLSSVILFGISTLITSNTKDIDGFNKVIEFIRNKSELKDYHFKYIDFKCQDDWDVVHQEISKDFIYITECQNKSTKNFTSIIASNHDPVIESWILGFVEELKNPKQIDYISGFKQDKFKEFNGYSLEYYVKDKLRYGKIIAFKTSKRAFLIIKEADTKEELNYYFSEIENSLNFK